MKAINYGLQDVVPLLSIGAIFIAYHYGDT